MRKLVFGIVAFVLVTLLASPMQANAQATNQADLVKKLTDAFNSYDADSLSPLLSQNAVLSYTSQAVDIGGASYAGRGVILGTFLPAVKEAGVQYEVTTAPQVAGNNVTWGWQETSPVLTSTKTNFLDYDMVGVIQDGKFQSINFSFTEDSIAKLRAEAAAQEPSGMPRTGQGGESTYAWLLVAGMLLVLCGTGIVQYSRQYSMRTN